MIYIGNVMIYIGMWVVTYRFMLSSLHIKLHCFNNQNNLLLRFYLTNKKNRTLNTNS